MKKSIVMIFLALALSVHVLLAQRPLNVLVFSEQYNYGKAGFALAEMLQTNPWHKFSVDFSNTSSILEKASLERYDVLVLFNHNDIDNDLESNVTRFVAAGGGLVALHHVVNYGNYNPELTRLIGGYYLMSDSSVQHRDFSMVRLPGVEHPVFEGVPDQFGIQDDQDFTMRFYPGQPVKRLLTCDLPGFEGQNDSGWTREEGLGRVIYLSPGDPVKMNPYVNNKPLARLIANAVGWAGKQM